jgi:D-lactate dehydrogenase (cytochrome)
LTENQTIRDQHANTLSELAPQPADAVVFPISTEEVVAIVKACTAHGVPMIQFGVGTSFEGQVNAPFGGISIDTSQMKSILSVHAEDLDCTVQAGVTREALNTHLRDQGLFFPIDPGANASFGGMASTRASGTNAVRYGTTLTNTLALTVVQPNGEVVHTGNRARKSASGYDLTRLFVGAEGTLGIITEITLRLHGVPEQISSGYCAFPDVAAACNTVIATIQSGIPVARIELLDEVQVKACNAYSKLDLPETSILFLEFHGGPQAVEEQIAQFSAISKDFGGFGHTWATRSEERSRLRQARHDTFWAAGSLRPGARGIPTDICVPISRLAECITQTKADIVEVGLVGPIVGHVGDGNFHALLLVDPNEESERARAVAVMDRMVERALSMDGTCSGEHGIGQSNRKYMIREHGKTGVALMVTIKKAIDPFGLMNPGKMIV